MNAISILLEDIHCKVDGML